MEHQTPASYNPAFYAHLAPVEERHFWFRARSRAIAAMARTVMAGAGRRTRILEVGCGTGNVLRALERACPGSLVVGMDLFAEGLVYARQRTGCPLVQADVQRPPFGGQFDVVGLFDVLEHLEDDVATLHAARRLVGPGGALLVTVPAHPWLWSYFDVASAHRRRYVAEELAGKLVTAGFEVEYLTPYMCAILPLVWAQRGMAKRRRQGDPMALAARELRIVPVVNDVLAWILEREAAAIARRWPLPFGTSLLAVARAT